VKLYVWYRAVFQINNDPNILPNVTLVMRWSDTRGETVEATNAMIEMICDGVVAFFGPEGSCYVEAIVAQARNIPMISYVSKSQVFTRVFWRGYLNSILPRVSHIQIARFVNKHAIVVMIINSLYRYTIHAINNQKALMADRTRVRYLVLWRELSGVFFFYFYAFRIKLKIQTIESSFFKHLNYIEPNPIDNQI